MSDRVPRVVRWTLGAAKWLVPAVRRVTWRRQWVAELEHRVAAGASSVDSIRFALGSVVHALYLRREEMTMRGWMADVKQSVRSLLRSPGFTVLTVATLAVGIGTASGVFSIVEVVLLRPLPMEGSERLVRVFSTSAARGSDRFSVSYPDYADFTARRDLFEASSFYIQRSQDLSGEGEPERVRIAAVHEGFFQTLNSPLLVGRAFTADDHRVDTEATAVLAESFWERRFGSDSTVVGRAIRLDGVPHVVVGIVSDAFAWPTRNQVWTTLQWGGGVPSYADARSNHTWQVIGRLQPDIGVRAASGQIREVARQIYSGEGIDEREATIEAVMVPLGSSGAGGETAGILGVMGAAVFFVLLISCLNASGLLLTRAWGRARELSLRAAMGAGRVRLVAMLLGESALLALLGGGLGLALAYVGLHRAAASLPVGGPDLTQLQLNSTVVGAALAISLVASLLAGLIPAVRASRASVAEMLKEGGGQSSQGRSAARLRQGLIVTELALSLALLVSSGMMIRGFQRQVTTDPGFDQSDILTFTVRLPTARYGEDALVEAYYQAAVESLERHPQVLAATTTSRLPLGAGGYGLFTSFVFEGAPSPPDGPEYGAAWIEVDPQYFRTLGIEPLEGRAFTDEDRADTPLLAIVSQGLARRMSPGESIIGREIRSFYDENLPRTVVGVIADLQFDGLSREQREGLVLVPTSQAPRASMAFMVRTSGDPGPLIPALRREMAALDPDVALEGMRSLRDAHTADLAGVRFLTGLFATFGALALVLAISGVYGLVSYSVSQRTQEIGIRMAMGASAAAVRGGVLVEGATMAAIGVAVGVAVAYGFSRVLAAAFFGLAEIEIGTFSAITVLLAAAVIGASWFPAVRATRVDPIEALRSE